MKFPVLPLLLVVLISALAVSPAHSEGKDGSSLGSASSALDLKGCSYSISVAAAPEAFSSWLTSTSSTLDPMSSTSATTSEAVSKRKGGSTLSRSTTKTSCPYVIECYNGWSGECCGWLDECCGDCDAICGGICGGLC